MAVRLISAYLAQKRLNPTSRHDVRLVHQKIFFSPIRASSWLLDSFRPNVPKNV